MNMNSMTIADVFAGKAGMVPAAKPEPGGKSQRVSNVGDEKQPQADAGRPVTPDNERVSAQKEPVEKTRKEFKQALREQEGNDLPKAQSNKKPEEQTPESEAVSRPELVQSWLAQSSVPVENSRQDTTKIDPKSGPNLAELISGLKGEEALPVTGQAAKSTEIKMLDKADKVQAGLNTVLPEKSQGLNGLKVIPTEPSEDISAVETVSEASTETETTELSEIIVGAKPAVENNQTEKTAAEVPDGVDSQVADDNKKPVTAEILPVGDTVKKAPSKDKDFAVTSRTEDGTRTASPDIKTPVINAETAAEPAKSSRPQQAQAMTETSGPSQEAEAKPVADISGFEKAKEASSSQRKDSNNRGGETANNTAGLKSGEAQVQVDTGQMQDRGADDSGNHSYQEIARVVSQSGPATQDITGTPSPSTFGTGAKPHNLHEGILSDTTADVGKQILESIHSSMSQQAAERQLTIRLNPPELGHVFVKLQEQNAQISGVLEVSRAQTQIEIERALPEITRNLAANGIQINRIEVVLSVPEHSAEHGARDALQQDGFFQQHSGSPDSGRSGNHYETSDTYYGLTNDSPYRDIAEFREMYVSDNAINVLM